jgi:hypothetical protein
MKNDLPVTKQTSAPEPETPPKRREAPWNTLILRARKLSLRVQILAGAGVILAIVIVASFSGGSAAKSQGPPPTATSSEGKQQPAPPAQSAPAAEANPAQVKAPEATLFGWVPVYPGTTPDVTSSVQTPESDQRVSTFKTNDSPALVVSFFQDQVKSLAFNVVTASSGEQGGMLRAEDALKKRSIIVSVEVSPEGTQTRVVAVERKI